VRFGLIVPQGWREDLEGRDFETMVAVARHAEERGYDSIWLYDHLQTRTGDPDRVLECWTSLAALARETSTVDAASGGRVVVGIGAGWDDREWRDFGYGEEYPAVRERLAHLERTLQVLRERRPGRPILVGGAGERVLLRLVARYADACNLTDSFDPAYYRHKLDVLRAHCEAVGRDYDEVEKTASFTVTTQDRVDFDALAAEGIERVILYGDPPADLEDLTNVVLRTTFEG